MFYVGTRSFKEFGMFWIRFRVGFHPVGVVMPDHLQLANFSDYSFGKYIHMVGMF